MSFHSQTAWSPNQHLNLALTSGGIANRRFANICFCKPLAGFLNQRDQRVKISTLFRHPPKLFPSVFSLRRKSGMSTNRNWYRGYGEVQGVPDLHVNSFPEWLQRNSRESTMRLSNVIVTELISVSQAEHVICQSFPAKLYYFWIKPHIF
ncbi:hypothetical protein CDAR_316071 [Caerostris darwini]|uniref:Uncharacterized protein n=1 Tax=Caerostris darwini TaxID=1538125 RepID=A0AAV4TS46_9ARAC|nr:hypothetical protein CDAR_316071 [Caerostris darwini]